jgi:hypothetical protein
MVHMDDICGFLLIIILSFDLHVTFLIEIGKTAVS